MEIIFLSGVSTSVLLIAHLLDYLLEMQRRSFNSREARSGAPRPRSIIAGASFDLPTRYDRAA
jgi:hypothetical protein